MIYCELLCIHLKKLQQYKTKGKSTKRCLNKTDIVKRMEPASLSILLTCVPCTNQIQLRLNNCVPPPGYIWRCFWLDILKKMRVGSIVLVSANSLGLSLLHFIFGLVSTCLFDQPCPHFGFVCIIFCSVLYCMFAFLFCVHKCQNANFGGVDMVLEL